jgi:hypothetical protein
MAASRGFFVEFKVRMRKGFSRYLAALCLSLGLVFTQPAHACQEVREETNRAAQLIAAAGLSDIVSSAPKYNCKKPEPKRQCATGFVLGDLNSDGIVDGNDLALLLTRVGSSDVPDGFPAGPVGETHIDLLHSHFGNISQVRGSLMGDLNGDGLVDYQDLGVLLSRYGTTQTPAGFPPGIVGTAHVNLMLALYGNSYCCFETSGTVSPDLNGDGMVNGADLANLLANMGLEGPKLACDGRTVNDADLHVLLGFLNKPKEQKAPKPKLQKRCKKQLGGLAYLSPYTDDLCAGVDNRRELTQVVRAARKGKLVKERPVTERVCARAGKDVRRAEARVKRAMRTLDRYMAALESGRLSDRQASRTKLAADKLIDRSKSLGERLNKINKILFKCGLGQPFQPPQEPSMPIPRFWVASWADVPASAQNIVEMGWIRGNGIGTHGISPSALDTLTEVLSKSPDGRRTLHAWRWRNSLLWHKNKSNTGHPDDRTMTPWGELVDIPSPYMHFAMLQYIAEVEVVAQGLIDRGVEVDRIVVDDENSGYLSGWHRSAEEIDAIIADPRFRSYYWPSPDEEGVAKTLYDMVGDITGADVKNPNTRHHMYRWNAAMDYVFHVQLNEALFSTLRRYFPNIRGSNYSASIVREDEATPDLNGHSQQSMSRFGTNPSGPFYGRVNQLANFYIDIDDPTNVVKNGQGEQLGSSGWVGLLKEINRARSMIRSDSTPIHAWIVDSAWHQSSFNQNSAYSEYRSDFLFHLALSGAEHFIYWTPFAPGYGVGGNESAQARASRFERVLALDDVVTELNNVAGGHALHPMCTEKLAWNSNFIVSCATRTDTTNLWRVTANRDVLSMNVNGTTVEFGEGMRGLWLEVPKNVDFHVTDVQKVEDMQLP